MGYTTPEIASLRTSGGVSYAVQETTQKVASMITAFGDLSFQKQVLMMLSVVFLACYALYRYTAARKATLLLDFECFKIPERLKRTRQELIDAMTKRGCFSDANLEFQRKIIERSGLGDETGLSDGILAMEHGPMKTSMQAAISETEEVIYTVVRDLLKKTGTDPKEIGVVMVSCSCFAPTPSMAAMLVNHFHMRDDVLTYNLSGMGCSSSLVCVDMAGHLLKALPNTLTLIVNHENITENWYNGNDRSMLVCNCLFRVGGAAALVSNRPRDFGRAKYELTTSLRTHLGCQDDAFGCMGVAEDADGVKGVFLRKNVIEIAGRALQTNIRALAPRVLPYSQLVRAAMDRKYKPDFSKAFEHFLLHTGGRGVIDELESSLRLSSKQAEPSKDTLWRFGNTSAASTWYILGRIESTSGVRKGDRVWQLGFGGGFKACSAVWKARKNIRQDHACWA